MVIFSQIHGILPDQGKQICGFHQIGFGIQVLMETFKKFPNIPAKFSWIGTQGMWRVEILDI